jgi:hypothetical protein
LGFKNPATFKGDVEFGFYHIKNKTLIYDTTDIEFKIIKLSDIPYK